MGRIQTEMSQRQQWPPLLGCSIHRGGSAFSIHGGVRESVTGIGSPLSASCTSQGAGKAASFRMRMCITEPPPKLLLEQPSLVNFAEFARIDWAASLLTRDWRKAPSWHTGRSRSFQCAALGTLAWIHCAPTNTWPAAYNTEAARLIIFKWVGTKGGDHSCLPPPLPSSRFLCIKLAAAIWNGSQQSILAGSAVQRLPASCHLAEALFPAPKDRTALSLPENIKKNKTKQGALFAESLILSPWVNSGNVGLQCQKDRVCRGRAGRRECSRYPTWGFTF